MQRLGLPHFEKKHKHNDIEELKLLQHVFGLPSPFPLVRKLIMLAGA
jgi:hypothetical protein